MNQTQALAKLRKVYGDKVGYRLNKGALNAEGRAKASEQAKTMLGDKTAARAAMEERMAELLRDPQYVALKAEYDRLCKAHDSARCKAIVSPITVGVVGSMFFSVKVEGDNWDEVVEKATAKGAA